MNSFNQFLSISVILILFGLLLTPLHLSAQSGDRSLEETLQMLSEDAASQYLSPISSAFGTNLNGGWFHRAPSASVFGFNFELGIVAMGSVFPDEAKAFSTSGTFRFSQDEARYLVTSGGQNYPQQVQDELVRQITSEYYDVQIAGATIIGDPEDYITITFPGYSASVQGQNYSVPEQQVSLDIGGFKELAEAKMMPLAAPQLTLGTVMGTQLTFRYLPDTELEKDLGTFKYFGFGLQHNPSVYLPFSLPVDLAASFFTQNLQVGDLFKTKTFAFGLNLSRQFGFRALNFTPYSGLMLESSKMEVTYDFIVDTPTGPSATEINFELEGENKARLTVGFNVRLGIFNLNADYNFGKYNSLTAGFFIAI